MVEPKKLDYLIDVENKEELQYIAEKLGCKVNDIISVVNTLETRKRSTIYSYLIDQAFKAHYK